MGQCRLDRTSPWWRVSAPPAYSSPGRGSGGGQPTQPDCGQPALREQPRPQGKGWEGAGPLIVFLGWREPGTPIMPLGGIVCNSLIWVIRYFVGFVWLPASLPRPLRTELALVVVLDQHLPV